jgi:hypothetical protein
MVIILMICMFFNRHIASPLCGRIMEVSLRCKFDVPGASGAL